jgi:adenine-specific DNA-methyltransferase
MNIDDNKVLNKQALKMDNKSEMKTGGVFLLNKNTGPNQTTLFSSENLRATQYFQLQNRRYLGNKFKLLNFIEEIVEKNCENINSFCDIFAGTGVVGFRFNTPNIKIITNDILTSNFVCLKTFLGLTKNFEEQLIKKIEFLNNLEADEENYFSETFGSTYFSHDNAKKIGLIRERIDEISESDDEKTALICALIYAADKVANTVGHYDAYRKRMDTIQPIQLFAPRIKYTNNLNNEIYKEDANNLIKKITCDILYIDPPYNSRQYSDAYHLLENLVEWEKPKVHGIAKKMDRNHIKSNYCLKSATVAFDDLIKNAQCRYILLSYNNTGDKKDGRSNARIQDSKIKEILSKKGEVKIFEKDYRAFTAGKSNGDGHTERIFFCKVSN